MNHFMLNEYEFSFSACAKMRTDLAIILNKTRHADPKYNELQMKLVDEMTKYCVCASELSKKNPSHYGKHTPGELSNLAKKIFDNERYQSQMLYFARDEQFLKSCLKR